MWAEENVAELEKEIKDLRRRNAALENMMVASDRELHSVQENGAKLLSEIRILEKILREYHGQGKCHDSTACYEEINQLRAANAQLTKERDALDRELRVRLESTSTKIAHLETSNAKLEARVNRYREALEQIAIRDEAGSGAHARMALAESKAYSEGA